MSSVGHENAALDGCISIFKDARTDEARFASLLLLTRVLPADDRAALDKVYAAVGLDFISRLLVTDDVPEGCGPMAFKEVGLAVLSALVEAPAAVCDPQLAAILPAVMAILSDAGVTESIIRTCILIMGSILNAHIVPPLSSPSPKGLCDAITQWPAVSTEASACLAHVLANADASWLQMHSVDVEGALLQLSQLFASSSGADKFQYADCIAAAVGNVTAAMPPLAAPDAPWVPIACAAYADALRNRLGREHSAALLRLCASMCGTMGAGWIAGSRAHAISSGAPSAPFGEKLLLLAVHMACVEVRMALEDRDAAVAARESTAVLASAFVILESAVEWLVEQQDLSSVGFQMHAVLREAYSAILSFAQEACQLPSSPGVDLVVRASIRALSAWLSEETEALRDDACAALEDIVRWCSRKGNDGSLALLLPALVNLTAEARGCNGFVAGGGIIALARQASACLAQIACQSTGSHTLVLVCEVILNLLAHNVEFDSALDGLAGELAVLLLRGDVSGSVDSFGESKIIAACICIARASDFEPLADATEAVFVFAVQRASTALKSVGGDDSLWFETVESCWVPVLGALSEAAEQLPNVATAAYGEGLVSAVAALAITGHCASASGQVTWTPSLVDALRGCFDRIARAVVKHGSLSDDSMRQLMATAEEVERRLK